MLEHAARNRMRTRHARESMTLARASGYQCSSGGPLLPVCEFQAKRPE